MRKLTLPTRLFAVLLVVVAGLAAPIARAGSGASTGIIGIIPVTAGKLTPQIHQGPFTEVFPPEEFAMRRARLMDEIGDDVAILQGTIERPGEQPFRQNNEVFYLSGVELPRVILVIDGRARRSTLYLPERNERRERAQGPELFVGDEAAAITGLDAVLDREEFAVAVAAFDGRTLWVPHRPEVLGNASPGDTRAQARATAADPWDGRPSREEVFIDKLHAAAPDSDIRDLDPFIDALRFIKSPREIEIIREATRITGLAIMEAMREAEPGMFEYELQAPAEYIFKKYGSQGAAYFALVATGPNTVYSHYHRGTRVLADGDLVQFDYAPDYRYYISDVTRVFPANGAFSPVQREFYTIYLRLYRAVLSVIRPGEPVPDLLREAGAKMETIIAEFPFTEPAIKAAAEQFAARYSAGRGRSFGHNIGMAVHDVGSGDVTYDSLQPGQMFTIEPALLVPDLGLFMRLEDALLVTDNGYENLSDFVPIEIDDIERTMAEPGISALIEGR
jgi:Xaa-Pro aminopeptidase